MGNIESNVVVRMPNWLGDLVMAMPALMQLKRSFSHVAALCPKGLAPVLRASDCVDETIPLENAHAFPIKEERLAVARFRAECGVLFNNSFRDALALRLCGVRRLFGTAARGRAVLLERSIRFPKRKDRELNPPHQAVRNARIAALAGAALWDEAALPSFRIGISMEEFQRRHGFRPAKPLLILAPGAAYGDAKRWDAEKFRRTALVWMQEKGGEVVAVGSGSEAPVCEECVRGVSGARSLAGRTSLEELMLLLAESDLCIANDSGVMHLAALLGARGVAIFGSTDPAATSPISKKWLVLYEKQPCSPCFRRICPLQTRACFKAIEVKRVLDAAEELLAQG